jgi:hypothetical protein
METPMEIQTATQMACPRVTLRAQMKERQMGTEKESEKESETVCTTGYSMEIGKAPQRGSLKETLKVTPTVPTTKMACPRVTLRAQMKER